ncbi:hypothetical protein CfE428DRAFT_3295 [Chthoniobacter flavus Ellin428]|uniref:Uncharacterized protein n=1 Tax=Chthoniobacter flavus Ellin428 TaxID=497964 RepID=B4D307_9BACT|nr:UPF0158 family protein [Chthoniobacter flavus]EDY19118.1 hypothetical protein CfE428DRAFT_3295 [Chthoniobacter flavus Ellin428]TCO87967.1 DUF3027 family protein [Chthoniobacter flavus]
MSELHEILWSLCQKLPSDFRPYGERDRATAESPADCSSGCIHFLPLDGELGMDWGVCANRKSPRAGLLTFEHQGCPEFEAEGETLAEEEKAPVEEDDEVLAAEAGPLRKLKIVEYELTDAIEQAKTYDGAPIPVYLDSETGEILELLSEWEDYEELSERIEGDPDRYYEINALDSHESFRIMEGFAESLPESSWKSRLIDALSGNKPFRRFKDAVHSDLQLRDQWFAFQQQALKKHARNWLETLGIEPEFVRTIDPQ